MGIEADFGADIASASKATLRECALQSIPAWRRRGCPRPAPLAAHTIRAIIDFIGGEPAPAGTHAMLAEELARDEDPRAPDLADIPAATRGGQRVLVIGAGMSGILAAHRCRQAGFAVTVLDKKPDARLVTERIETASATGLRTADGIEHAADVLIYGTGFHADRFLWPMRMTGRDGVMQADRWGATPRACKGISVPQFPNLVLLYGPNTNIVVGSSIFFFSDYVFA